MDITIYHNPDCSKSCSALNQLHQSPDKVAIINYLEQPLSKEKLTEIIEMLGIPANELIRKNEPEFEPYLHSKLSENDCINLMVKFPVLIQRPIVINGNKAFILRPPLKLEDLV